MSIASEITRLQQAKSDLATSITNKGVTVPAATTLDGYAALVDQIQQGGTTEPPYDAEVEYLHSNGNQYIDSGIECTGDLKVEFVGLITTNVNAAACGGIHTTSPYFRHHWSPYNNSFYWIQHSTETNASISLSSSRDTWYTIIIDPANGTGSVNGSGKTFTALSASSTTGQNYFIFARKASDGGVQSRPCRFKSFKMWRNNVLLRDFIPVRIGQVGYMYDKVSNKFFGNVGTGSFTLGSDKS